MQIPDWRHGRTCESEVRYVEVIHGYWGIGRRTTVRDVNMDWVWRGGLVFDLFSLGDLLVLVSGCEWLQAE